MVLTTMTAWGGCEHVDGGHDILVPMGSMGLRAPAAFVAGWGSAGATKQRRLTDEVLHAEHGHEVDRVHNTRQ